MVEIHLVASKSTAAIGAWDLPELAKEGRGRGLPARDPLDLGGPIRGVITDVHRSLVSSRRQGLF